MCYDSFIDAQPAMVSQRPIRFGILGAARIAPSALVQPAASNPDVEVVAIAARDRRRAREFAAANRIARVHQTYADLVADPDLDAIYNPLPNSMHCEWSLRALAAGKHVLCEKPLASNAEEAARMAQAADDSGLLLVEGFHYRYHPLAHRIAELIRGGAIGKLTYVEGHFAVPIPSNNIRFDLKLAGGATMDLGCYPLHMIRSFSGMTPRVVAAHAQVGPPNIDVSMEADLELAPGVTARMTCSMAADVQAGAYFLARGEHGEIRATNPISPHRGHQLTVTTPAGTTTEAVPGEATFTYQLRAFVAAMRGDRAAFPTDARDGIIGMRIIDDVYRAAGLPPRGNPSVTSEG
ncbi:MAG TPA: Gfo/Idh/MocA family oxidoreductase [Candidatus Binataceae bacterium]|nr:Gfo/Idh/MocA family oxidoreductase [Candidatus Binataceae bacterium]